MVKQDILLNAIINSCTIGVMVLKPLDPNDGLHDLSIGFLNKKGLEIIVQGNERAIEGSTLLKEFPELADGVLIHMVEEVLNTGKSVECDYEWQVV